MKTIKIKVDGMMCTHCTAAVRAALEKVAGVKDVEVSLSDGIATVMVADGLSDDLLTAAIDGQGYDCSVVQ